LRRRVELSRHKERIQKLLEYYENSAGSTLKLAALNCAVRTNLASEIRLEAYSSQHGKRFVNRFNIKYVTFETVAAAHRLTAQVCV